MKDAENFQEWAKDYVLFSHITSKVKGAKYPNLLSQKGGGGFPYCVFMDAEGNVLAKLSGARTVANMKKTRNTGVKAFLDLKEKAAAGDAGAKFDYLLARIELGHLSADAAKRESEGLELTRAQAEKLTPVLTELKIADILKPVRNTETAIVAGRQLAPMMKDDIMPSDPKSREWYLFMRSIIEFAGEEKMVELYEDAFNRFKEQFGANRRHARTISEMEKNLETLKSESGEEQPPSQEDDK